MTKKRFEIKVNKHNQCNIIDWAESKENAVCIYNDLGDDYFSSARALCELLNELNDENKQLEKEYKELNQLRANISRELLIYRRIASCSNCKYQNYDWFDDGDEFEVCDKGNNNQQIEYHICKEWEEI